MRTASETAVTRRPARALALALLLALPVTASAHGGVYRGPNGRVPPDRREPSDTPPPPWSYGAAGKVHGAVSGFTDWSFWWGRRQDRVLDAAVAGRARDLDPDEIRRWVLPALRRLLRGKTVNFDISSAAAIALARMGDTESREFILQCMSAPGQDVHRVLEETSALALGMLDDGDGATDEALRAVLADGERNRNYVRPFAAFALALRGRDGSDRTTVDALIAAGKRKEVKPDVIPAAFAALGAIGDARSSNSLGEPAFGEDDAPDGVPLRYQGRAAAIAARGADHDPESAIDGLLAFVARNEPHELRREAVLALGSAAARANNPSFARPALERLIAMLAPEAAEAVPRPVEPEHVIQAIGLVAASPDAVGGAARAFLEGALRTETRPSVRANVAVCLGLAAREREADGGGATAVLRGLFAQTKEPQERAAYALALGLAGDHEAVPALRVVVADATADDDLRGYSALALGLLGSGESEVVALAGPGAGPEARIQAHLALGLLGGDRARQTSLAALRPAPAGAAWDEAWIVRGAAAWALGADADMDAIAALVEIAEDHEGRAADIDRALAVVAIGRACARPGAPTLDALRDAIPYRVLTPALVELLTFL